MDVWLVTPAWRRFSVTRLALAQRRVLCDELAARGITASCVVVADDENLEIAAEHGFETVEVGNSQVGRKLNAGLGYAAAQGADYLAFVGSDDWLHPDLFEPLLDEPGCVVSGRILALCDLVGGRLRYVAGRGRQGVIPWLIPRAALEPCGFAPLPDAQNRGLDLNLALALADAEWRFHDPHPLARVDFKSDLNMTPYRAALGYGGERLDPWEALATAYPADLVALAERTAREYRYAEAAA